MSRTHIYKECKNESCPSHNDKSLGNIWGDTLHHIFVDNGRELATCDVCSETYYFKDPDHKWKVSYPYFNSSIDKVFNDKYEEKQYVKANDLVVKDFKHKHRSTKTS